MNKFAHILVIVFLTTGLISAQQVVLTAEPNHSTIGFRIDIAGFTMVTGKFTDYTIDIDMNENIVDAKFRATIQASSIHTGIPDRDDHLRTEDFFNVDSFPTITFLSEQIQRISQNDYLARGKFTMHGITKTINLPFMVTKRDGNTIGFKMRTVINRLDYDIGSSFKHSSIPDFLANEIDIEIDFWTKKKKLEE